jgi:uncharacterized membrane protein YhhN
MATTILIVYIIVGLIQEASGLFFWETPRKITKALLLPVLIVFYFAASSSVLVTVIIAFAFSWLGDVLLIKKEIPKFFRLGMVAFLLSHVFYIVAFLSLTNGIHLTVLIVSCVIAAVAEIFLPRIINPPKAMKIPIIVYGVVILVMSVAALQYMLSAINIRTILLFAGSVIFIFSDCFMSYHAFREKPKYFNAMTMLPYIIAQGLIAWGLAGA